ncbi:hypothetical protein ECZU34_47610 [Escherichia coli]|nr:hypothetical protein ECZU34_47610 [Escherichia coli]
MPEPTAYGCPVRYWRNGNRPALDHIDDAHWQAIFQTRYAHVTRIVRTYKDKLPR